MSSPGVKQTGPAAPAWTVRSLTRTRKDGTPYTREPDVEAQVRDLCAASERARRERWAVLDRAHPDFVREETLVYALREYAVRGEDGAAWQIADLLVQRVAGHVRRELSRWRLGDEDRDDCTRDLFAVLCDALFDSGPSAEFWEVRFWVCLDRRLWNLAEKRQQVADAELAGSYDAGSDADDPLARIPDAAPGPEAQAELKNALAALGENERAALYLCYTLGWPEESENPDQPSAARALGVTGRTVRNYLRSAKHKLRAWERG